MIDLLLEHGADPRIEADLLGAIADHARAVRNSAGAGDTGQVGRAEAIVRADPAAAFTLDATGMATLNAADRTWCAGRFESISLGTLRARASAQASDARLRLCVLDGAGPATDIGSLQAHSDGDTLFQVASQFNCLEASEPRVRSVASYLNDSTQGPRAAISAFPGTLLRHYFAPGARGERFVQINDGHQVNLLADVCDTAVAAVENGYLLASNVARPKEFAAALETRFDAIRVGVHEGVEVVLGYDWGGTVIGRPRVTQVFTSTLAGGAHGRLSESMLHSCRLLVRAAYLGTLLAAASLQRHRVVLTLIGGGVFANPVPLIWDSIIWALAEVEPLLARDLDVVINGRNLGSHIDRDTILAAVRARNGVLLAWPRTGGVAIHR